MSSARVIRACHSSRMFTFFADRHHGRTPFITYPITSIFFSSFMTDEAQRLSIISRRVCGDLLQRLLGSAAGTSPQAPTPVCRTQGCSTSPGGDKNQDSENRAVHGPVDNDVNGGGDDLDDLPPLEGEDSDKENKNAASVKASLPASVSAKAAAKDNVRIQKNTGASAKPINHSRPAAVGDASVAPFRLVCLFLTLLSNTSLMFLT